MTDAKDSRGSGPAYMAAETYRNHAHPATDGKAAAPAAPNTAVRHLMEGRRRLMRDIDSIAAEVMALHQQLGRHLGHQEEMRRELAEIEAAITQLS